MGVGAGSLKILTSVLVHRLTRPLRGSVSCGSGWSVPCVSIQLTLSQARALRLEFRSVKECNSSVTLSSPTRTTLASTHHSSPPAASKSSARRVPRACTSWPDDVDASRPRRRNARITTRTSPKDDETRSRTTDGRARRDPALPAAPVVGGSVAVSGVVFSIVVRLELGRGA